jgi:SAM-dependent methyltransferase
MSIMQPDRVLLRQQITRFAGVLTGKVLDVGCGGYKRYHPLFPAAEFVTLDFDDKHHPDLVGSAEAMPLPDGSVDGILCTQVLEHVPHPATVIGECMRVLRPGGKALLTVPQWNELHEEPYDFFRYTCFGLETLSRDAGFEILATDQRGKYHSCLCQMRIRRWIDRLQPSKHPLVSAIFGPLTNLYTRYAVWRDLHDQTTASQKHALGWLILLQKPDAHRPAL